MVGRLSIKGPLIARTAAGKTVAWINYMTNVNKVYGNFAAGMSEEFMVLNRNYSMGVSGNNRSIEDLTTYIDPVKYNYIFADTNLDAMNFWLQIKFDITARRLISANKFQIYKNMKSAIVTGKQIGRAHV